MNKEKWLKIYDEEFVKANYSLGFDLSPNNWGKYRTIMMTYLNEVDKATEVYFMENPKEKQNGST